MGVAVRIALDHDGTPFWRVSTQAVAQRYVLCPVGDLPRGARKIVDAGGRSIGVFNIDGAYFALKNVCPHQFAPLCRGNVVSRTLPSKPGEYVYGPSKEVIRCPWHGWEFDIKTGKSVFNPHRVRVKTYEVRVEADVEQDEDPSVETYPVKVEQGFVVLYV